MISVGWAMVWVSVSVFSIFGNIVQLIGMIHDSWEHELATTALTESWQQAACDRGYGDMVTDNDGDKFFVWREAMGIITPEGQVQYREGFTVAYTTPLKDAK